MKDILFWLFLNVPLPKNKERKKNYEKCMRFARSIELRISRLSERYGVKTSQYKLDNN